MGRTVNEISGHAVTAHEVSRDGWNAVLQRSGLGERHARLIADLYDAHNAGRIDIEADTGAQRWLAISITLLGLTGWHALRDLLNAISFCSSTVADISVSFAPQR